MRASLYRLYVRLRMMSRMVWRPGPPQEMHRRVSCDFPLTVAPQRYSPLPLHWPQRPGVTFSCAKSYILPIPKGADRAAAADLAIMFPNVVATQSVGTRNRPFDWRQTKVQIVAASGLGERCAAAEPRAAAGVLCRHQPSSAAMAASHRLTSATLIQFARSPCAWR